MDGFIQSFSTQTSARQLTKNLRTVFQRGGLTEFISNNHDVLSANPAEDREKSASETKVLGQTWCLRTDSYTAPPPKTVDNPTTLRLLFSLVSSIFDPIGLLIQDNPSISLETRSNVGTGLSRSYPNLRD